MKINNQQLIGLPAITQSGQELGTVENFNIDIDTQSVLEYKIKPSSLVTGLIEGDLFVSRGQVVEISADRLVVEDNIQEHQALAKFKKVLASKKESVALNKD